MSTLRKGLRYGVVGLVATAVHTVVVLVWMTTLGRAPGWANGWAFLVATAVSYGLNTRWSFAATHTPARLSRYLAVTAVCFVAAVGVATAIDRLGWHFMIGILATAMTVPWIGFALHRGWTYRDTA